MSDIFLSTLSLRRATAPSRRLWSATGHFYPRSPCGERPRSYCNSAGYCVFLSTLSLRRATAWADAQVQQATTFLSTLSLRRATQWPGGSPKTERNFYPRSPCGERHGRVNLLRFKRVISIHALLAESDEQDSVDEVLTNDISIHALLAESDTPK